MELKHQCQDVGATIFYELVEVLSRTNVELKLVRGGRMSIGRGVEVLSRTNVELKQGVVGSPDDPMLLRYLVEPVWNWNGTFAGAGIGRGVLRYLVEPVWNWNV